MITSKADFHDKRLPNESPEYRAARNELLAEEVSLREQLERVLADHDLDAVSLRLPL